MPTQNATEQPTQAPCDAAPHPVCLAQPAPWRIAEVLALVAILVAAVGLRLLFFVGTRGGDDLRHAFHGYFLFAPDEVKHAVIALPDGTIYRRMGINLPVWLVTRVFGPHEWAFSLVPLIGSLIGVVAIFLLLRRLAGRAAGLTAAAMWALLPADVGNATLQLQDSVFASLLALLLLFMVWAHLKERGAFLHALLAGLVLGYLQYVKRSAVVLIPPLIVWELITWWHARRFRWLSLYACLGFALMQVAFGLLFWHLKGDFWWYWRQTLYVTTIRLGEDNHSLTEVIAAFRQFFVTNWALGGAIVFLPLALPAALLDRRVPARLLFAIILACQSFILLQAWRMVDNQERYVLQVSPLIVALLLLGVFALLTRLPPLLRRALTIPVCLLLLAATAWPLELHARYSNVQPFEAHWLAYRYLDATAGPHDTIYGKPREKWTWDATLRALYQYNGFEAFKGGFADVAAAPEAKSGWVVLSSLDMRKLSLDTHPCPENWLEVYHACSGWDSVRIFKILPEPLKLKPRLFIAPPTPPVPPPDVAGLDFQAVRFEEPADQYQSHWLGKSESVVVRLDPSGLHCEARAAADPKSRNYVGLRIPAPRMKALRLLASFVHPENIQCVYADAYDTRRRRLARWQWYVRDNARPPEHAATYVFVPGEPSGYFAATAANASRPIAEVHLFLRLQTSLPAGVVIHDAEVAQVEEPPASENPR